MFLEPIIGTALISLLENCCPAPVLLLLNASLEFIETILTSSIELIALCISILITIEFPNGAVISSITNGLYPT